MAFQRFIEIIDASAPMQVEAMASTPVRVSSRKHPKSEDEKLISAFGEFLKSGIVPDDLSKDHFDFYMRTSEKLVSIYSLPPTV